MSNFSLYFVSMTHKGEDSFSCRYVYTTSPERASELAVMDAIKFYPVEEQASVESKVLVGLIKVIENEGIVDFVTRKIDENRTVHYKVTETLEQQKFKSQEKVELGSESDELQAFMDWKA